MPVAAVVQALVELGVVEEAMVKVAAAKAQANWVSAEAVDKARETGSEAQVSWVLTEAVEQLEKEVEAQAGMRSHLPWHLRLSPDIV